MLQEIFTLSGSRGVREEGRRWMDILVDVKVIPERGDGAQQITPRSENDRGADFLGGLGPWNMKARRARAIA